MPEKKEAWYAKPLNDVFKSLNSTKEGLSSGEAEKRIKEYGYNEIKEAKKDTPFRILLRQFKSFVVGILIVAAIISFFIGHNIELVVILVIIVFVILINFLEEYKASKDMAALISLTPKKSIVLRDNKKTEILSKEVTIGDILILERGNIVGADARLIEANSLKLEEAALTGESVPVTKLAGDLKAGIALAQQTNMVFAGTNITNGDGLAVVVRIGEATEIGKISRMIKGIKEETTPLQKRLDKLTKQISIAAMIVAMIVFVVGVLRGTHWSGMLIFSMAVIISGIPESLPTVVAVTLATGVKKMAKRNAIIKRLPAVETLGTCTVICSDKTGTLTQNKMVIENIFTSDIEIRVTGEGYRPEGVFLKENIKIDVKKHKTASKIFEIGVLCNNADIKKEKNDWVVDGEATEGALITVARKAGIAKSDYHKKFPRKKEHPFDPVRKCMSTVHVYQGKHVVYSKGAPEMLLKKAKYYLDNGKVKKLNKPIIDSFLQKNKEYASKGLRVLGLAFKEHKGSLELKSVESNLIFVGLVSIRDPPEPSVKESVKRCKEAGIRVVMITGDNEITAKAIATELGIFSEKDTILTGKELDQLNEQAFEKIINSVSVYARVAPAHKLRIVQTLQKVGHIAAMTGDGVNDAPALKKADIGIAMGKCGTDVAKEAAELVLKDDNFTTIVNAVEEGRTIYENIRKFIYYLLVGNFSEVLIILIAVIVGASLPLTALMILFINLVTSELPALGLSFEKPSAKIMKQKPREPKEGILSDYLLFKIGELVPLIVLGAIALYIWELVMKGAAIPKAQTIAFATIIFFELFHALNAKSWDESIFTKNFFSNIYVLGGITLAAVLTIIAIYLPFLQGIFGTVSLGLYDWLPVLIVASSAIFFIELQKTLLQAELKEREKMEIHPTRAG
ncbi:HAD-IC family P-type ATPase [Candidatus Woesearchaeota archaeon]|nr:HAD-IC family P-type ATPase [Candidatus Woesearchaeota archaeon]